VRSSFEGGPTAGSGTAVDDDGEPTAVVQCLGQASAQVGFSGGLGLLLCFFHSAAEEELDLFLGFFGEELEVFTECVQHFGSVGVGVERDSTDAQRGAAGAWGVGRVCR
jgi:hypothetical protein